MNNLIKLYGGVLLLALFALAACDSANVPETAAGANQLAGLEQATAEYSEATRDLSTDALEEADLLLGEIFARHIGNDVQARNYGPFTVNLCDSASVEQTLNFHYPGDIDVYKLDLVGGTGDLSLKLEILDYEGAKAAIAVCVDGVGCETVLDPDGVAELFFPNIETPVRATISVAYSALEGRDVNYRLTGSFAGAACEPPPPEDCVACGTEGDPDAEEADKVSELTMRYDGAETALVEVYNDKDAKPDELLFSGMLSPGEEFTIRASDLGEERFNNDVGFFINGERNTKLHTSCSRPLGPGTISGLFTVVAGKDKLGRPLCPDDPSMACDCDGGVKELTMRYDGAEMALVEVYNDNDNDDPDKLLFSGMLSPGEEFTIRSSDLGEEDFNNNVAFYVDGQQDAEVHTSCSRPIGPNLVAGRFFVVSGIDKRGNMLCPLEPSANCDCDGGVKQLTMRYDGDVAAWVTVYNDGSADEDKILFSAMVAPGEEFSFMASTLGEDKFKSNISFYIESEENTELHTSCSQPIGEGQVAGAFTVISGIDRMDNMLCPIN